MTVEMARKLIKIYKQDYCNDKYIKEDQKIHTRFVRMMMDRLGDELEGRKMKKTTEDLRIEFMELVPRLLKNCDEEDKSYDETAYILWTYVKEKYVVEG